MMGYTAASHLTYTAGNDKPSQGSFIAARIFSAISLEE